MTVLRVVHFSRSMYMLQTHGTLLPSMYYIAFTVIEKIVTNAFNIFWIPDLARIFPDFSQVLDKS